MSWRKLSGIFLAFLISFNIILIFVYNSQPTSSGTHSDLNGIAWKSDGSYALIVGDDGTILTYDHSSFEKISSHTNHNLLDVEWKPDGSYALIAGEYGTILKYNESDKKISEMKSYTDAYLSGLCWKDNNVAFIVGGRGTIFRWEDEALTMLEPRTGENLQDIAWKPYGEYALIVGSNGTVLREYGNDTNFTQLPKPTPNFSNYLFGVSWNPRALWEPHSNYALIVGEGGSVLRYDGNALTQLPNSTNNWLTEIDWKPDGSYALIVGTQGTSLAYDGNSFSVKPSATNRILNAAAWKPNDSYALLVGDDGTVRKYPSLGIDPTIVTNIWYGELFAFIGVAFATSYDIIKRKVKKYAPMKDLIKGDVVTKSAIEYSHAHILYKVKIENNTTSPISDIRVKPFLPKELFILNHDEKAISLIRPNESKTTTFKLRPRGECENIDIFGKVSYYDPDTDNYKEVDVKPKTTEIICPVLRRKKIGEDEWRELVQNLLKLDESMNELPISGRECFDIAAHVIKDKNIYMLPPKIIEKEGMFRGVAKFYCEGIKGLKYAVQIEVIAGPAKDLLSKLIINIYAESRESLIGFYYNILDDVEKRVGEIRKDFVLMQHVADLTIKMKEHEEREKDMYEGYEDFRRLQTKINKMEKEKIGMDEKLKSLYELDKIYKLLAKDLIKRKDVDIREGEKIVEGEIDKRHLEEIQRFKQAYELLCEAEASNAMDIKDLPESGKKALLLVYFNAAEIFIREKLKELVPRGITILLGDEFGHINTRKKDWEGKWNNLSLGSCIYAIKNNKYLFLKNEEKWDKHVETLMHTIRDMRNNIAHPSKKNPNAAIVREKVYEIINELTDVLKEK